MYYAESYAPEEILVYLRKSRSDDQSLTLEEVLQKHESILREWMARNLPSPVPEENIYREIESGETLDGRPEVLKLLKRIESPRIRAILVVEVQRISRGDLEDCGRVMKILRYTNTKVITPTKTYDLSDEYDREVFERELKRGNDFLEYYKKIQARGKLVSVTSGNFIGSVAPYGYEKTTIREGHKKHPTLKIKESEADIVRYIFEQYGLHGIGLVDIATSLDNMNIPAPNGTYWNYHTLKDMISNEHYIGMIPWGKRKHVPVIVDQEVVLTRPKQQTYQLFQGKHPAIISKELWDKVQERKQNSARPNYNDRPLTNPFASLLYCRCGSVMQLRSYKQASGHYSSPRYICRSQTHCNSGSILASELTGEICRCMEAQIEDFELSLSDGKEKRKQQEKNLSILTKRLNELEQKELSLWDKYSEDGMPKEIFERLKEKVLKEKAEVTRSIQTLMENPVADYSERIVTFKHALAIFHDDSVTVEAKNRFLCQCIERITYHRERPQRTRDNVVAINGWDSPPFELDIKFRI